MPEPTRIHVPIGSGRIALLRHGSGAPLLVLHAAGGAGEWNEYLELLSAAVDVIAPDHPGFGHSDDLPEVTDTAGIARLYLELLDRLGIGPVDVAGASFGGWVAAQLASLAPERVRRLVLMAPAGLHLPEHPPADLAGLGPEGVVRALYLDPRRAEEVLAAPRSAPALARAARDAAAAARFARALPDAPPLHDPELPGRLTRISAPTLVLLAEQDEIIPREHGQAYASAIPGARTDTVAGCGHALYFEQPRAVADRVLRWVGATR
ncbi:pimeloyl-ACP methyl ester carboxylesterase [Pseudonocardia autotrophica]|uniref:2-hydroxymuconate semialdehyde hydrolase n=2 Tax=Pseudonocardia TaxID=1847 RepID=A0A1Y2MMA9_PSEAH|nr:2-hydroxymuconate semialdehyde hydrolase [Pseudonocardia autotrophica]TDN72658.1 pimeloyl-ACP methyl ester carboxylesterase [Pseudonocardia autotrophica]BBG03371.1 hydrolase [Pseudonocardia autotrophica]GEC27274.1 hydrolase [Pseudonocardia saturnea]